MVPQGRATAFLAGSAGSVAAPAERYLPRHVRAPSPNHGGPRPATVGVVLHSTRGGTSSQEREFQATLNWFANPSAQVSAHVVIGADGTLAEVVDPDQQAWHDPSTNANHLGVELTQPRYGDPFTDGHINTLAWWLRKMADRYGFALTPEALPFHSMTRSGNQQGKSDAFRADDPAGEVFMDRLMARLTDQGWTV